MNTNKLNENNKKIVFVAERYPNQLDQSFVFLKNLVEGLNDDFKQRIVIAPQSITSAIITKTGLKRTHYIENNIYIYRPIYLSFGSHTYKLNYYFFMKVVNKILKKIDNIDIIYCKFYTIGLAVARVLDKRIPIIVDCGESRVDITEKTFNKVQIKKYGKKINGVVYVSSKNYKEACSLGLHGNKPYIIAPNSIDHNEFYKEDKKSSRKKLNWNNEDFVVSYVGWFINRKGITRLSEALTKLNKKYKISSCFIGSGELKPTCSNIIFEGPVKHSDIRTYLCASDIFVLPTLAEGCCNAIIEAGACGLPIITSNKDFNLDILNNENALLIDPENVDEIYMAIEELYLNKKKRENLSTNILKTTKNMNIKNRSKAIAKFINGIIDNYENSANKYWNL